MPVAAEHLVYKGENLTEALKLGQLRYRTGQKTVGPGTLRPKTYERLKLYAEALHEINAHLQHYQNKNDQGYAYLKSERKRILDLIEKTTSEKNRTMKKILLFFLCGMSSALCLREEQAKNPIGSSSKGGAFLQGEHQFVISPRGDTVP